VVKIPPIENPHKGSSDLNTQLRKYYVYMNNVKSWIFLLVGLCSCGKEIEPHDPYLIIEYVNPGCEPFYISPQAQLEANFRALYYGPRSKHIKVDLKNYFTQLEMYSHFNDVMNIKDANIVELIGQHPLHPTKDYASIFIDTTMVVQTNILLNEKKHGIGKRVICASHYIVRIENNHRSFFCVGYGDELEFAIEAKNSKGEWKPITHPPIRFCGTGLLWVPLSANEIVLSAIPIIQGNFKTKGRIKFGEVYSNEINISIDTNTFYFPI